MHPKSFVSNFWGAVQMFCRSFLYIKMSFTVFRAPP